MDPMEQLKLGKVALLKKREELAIIEKRRWRKRKISRLKKEIKTLNRLQFDAAFEIVSHQNPRLKELAKANYELFQNSQIQFKVTKSDTTYFSSYTKELKGSIHNNGFIYCKSTKTSWELLDKFQHYLAYVNFGVYPRQFNGGINYLGEIHLEVTKYGYTYFGSRVPRAFSGEIDKLGNVIISLIENDWEPNGDHYFSRLIADPFKGNETKRQQFIRNKDVIINEVSRCREGL